MEDILGVHVHTCEHQTWICNRHLWSSVPACSNLFDPLENGGTLDQSHRNQIVSYIPTSFPTPQPYHPPSIQDTQLQQLHGKRNMSHSHSLCCMALIWYWYNLPIATMRVSPRLTAVSPGKSSENIQVGMISYWHPTCLVWTVVSSWPDQNSSGLKLGYNEG